MTPRYFIGLMSGTSADGIDGVLIKVAGTERSIAATHHRQMPEALRQEILAFRTSGDNELHRLASLDRLLAAEYALCVAALLAEAGLSPDAVTAIGSHGQTLRHQPDADVAYTVQVGDPNELAERAGICVVADFRRRDLAAGGQGAPLVPAFHKDQFWRSGETTAIINIGGIANVTLISATGEVSGWDTGPGNTLMDAWIHHHRAELYDAGGAWAASGNEDASLLEALLSDPYFHRSAPKSTGPEYFNLDWLWQRCRGNEDAADVQRTLLSLTVHSIAAALAKMSPSLVRVCGGGALNHQLMAELASTLAPATLTSTDVVGVAPQWVEACAFAWLAERTLEGLPGNEPSVTGADGYRILGGVYPA